ncbi:hypothetical protein AAVH_32128 [Aphelenchoides avenae]|nr:hypothetical protein AAVH_32128 [Aphelenchus avenae]
MAVALYIALVVFLWILVLLSLAVQLCSGYDSSGSAGDVRDPQSRYLQVRTPKVSTNVPYLTAPRTVRGAFPVYVDVEPAIHPSSSSAIPEEVKDSTAKF